MGVLPKGTLAIEIAVAGIPGCFSLTDPTLTKEIASARCAQRTIQFGNVEILEIDQLRRNGEWLNDLDCATDVSQTTILEVRAGGADNVMSTDAKRIIIVFCIASPEQEGTRYPFDCKQNGRCNLRPHLLDMTEMTFRIKEEFTTDAVLSRRGIEPHGRLLWKQ